MEWILDSSPSGIPLCQFIKRLTLQHGPFYFLNPELSTKHCVFLFLFNFILVEVFRNIFYYLTISYMYTMHLEHINPSPSPLFPWHSSLNTSPSTFLSFPCFYITHWGQSVLPTGMLADFVVWCWMCNNGCSGSVSGMVVSGPKGPDHFIALLPVFQILHSLHFLFSNEPSSLARELIQISYLGDSTPQSIMFLSCLRYKYRDFLKQFHMSQLICTPKKFTVQQVLSPTLWSMCTLPKHPENMPLSRMASLSHSGSVQCSTTITM